MDETKFYDVFNPSTVEERIHIIGCGSVGSTIRENLARMGLTKFTLYDFDIVEAKNIHNQMFNDSQIGQPKVQAVYDNIVAINPEAKSDIEIESEGWDDHELYGYVILAVDSIELRKKICESNKYNHDIKAVFDVRTGLFDAEHRRADWSNMNHRNELIKSMQFSDADAAASTPVSRCGVVLGLCPTVRDISLKCVINLFNFIRDGKLKTFVRSNPYEWYCDAGSID